MLKKKMKNNNMKNNIKNYMKKSMLVTMKSVLAVMLIASCLVLLNSCSYNVKVGKKCTPGSTEWSYLWLVKGETDVSKANCE